MTVGSHSRMDGAIIRDLPIPPNTVFISIRRGSDETIATADHELMAGDHILVAGHHGNELEVRKLGQVG